MKALLLGAMAERAKIREPALQLSCELLRVFVCEAINRAAKIAREEDEDEDAQLGSIPQPVSVMPAHLERVLPQLLLDF